MRFFHRLLSLSLCGILLLGMPGPVWALSPTPEWEPAVAAVNPVSDLEPKPDAAVNQVPDSEPKPDAAANQVPDSEPKPVCYLPLKPVTHVYLPYGGGFDDFKAAMGGLVQDLYPNGDSYAEPMPFTYLGDDTNGDEFTKLLHDAVGQNREEFPYRVAYGINRNMWAQQPEKLAQWDGGLIETPEEYDVIVHLRPAGLRVTYHPDPEAPIPTVWADRNDPFDWLKPSLADYDSFIQTASPYDPPDLDFTVNWEEQSYLNGMKSGADQFYITGTCADLYRYGPGDPEYDLYRKGLIEAEGQPKALVHVKTPSQLFYYNPYFPQFNRYKNVYQFQINIAPDTDFSSARLPSTADLDPFQGDPQDALAFGLEWNRKEYEDGLASGADSFTVSGTYARNPEWPPKLQDRWQNGELKVLNDAVSVTPPPELTVNVRKDGLPFTVRMEYRMTEGQGNEGLIPVFTFPWPNGAKKVTTAVSFDQKTWYQEDVTWSDEYEWNDAEWHFVHSDENGKLVAVPRDDPIPFYCKLIVTGSPFAGETQLMKVSPGGDGTWEMAPDQGGDHGGGGQGEHDRPGKDDPTPKPNPSPESDRNPQPSPESDRNPQPSPESHRDPQPSSQPDPELGPNSSVDSGSGPTPQTLLLSGQQEQKPDSIHPFTEKDAGASLRNQGEKSALPAPRVQTASVPAASPEVPSSLSDGADEKSAHATQPDGSPSHSGDTLSSSPGSDPASVSQPESDPASKEAVATDSKTLHIPGFVGAAAATAAVILCGAVCLRWFKKRK